MYGLLNIGSLILGLAAWGMPVAALTARRNPAPFCAASCGLCCFSLFFQILYPQHLVAIRDWSAMEDTHGAVVFAALVLLAGTCLLNALALVLSKLRR